MKRDFTIYLTDILESAELIEGYTKDISEDEFYQSSEKQDAVLHRIQIIGEAAKKVPEEYRKRWSDIPWKEISGMRDIIVHEYFGITMIMVWKVAVEDIPSIKLQIINILNSLNT
ncbi:MAG: DUF86 domain-containing protein [Bacteroidales bacterium]|nr:DUF86 domain-containing protein [Bacteroidota bacterium]MBL6950288.1 DUF86 domain-containing protein [Bacteroidales bacterium]